MLPRVAQDSPTAAFRLLDIWIKAATNAMHKAQAMMSAMFPTEPSIPALKIPQFGLTPTGALFLPADAPVSVDGEVFSN